MLTIHKYDITDGDPIRLPKDAQVLSVGAQKHRICMWALIETSEQRTETRRFVYVGTGHSVPNDLGAFIGTVQVPSSMMPGGVLVFYVFEGGV